MKKKTIIKDHILIPEHIKLTKKETEDLLKNYNISLRQLPGISRKDPALSSFEVVAGDVIKIVRKSYTDNQTVFFRVVMDE